MAWFKIDDGFYDNPKVKAIPRGMRMDCLGLWVTAGAWASKHLTGGVIPTYMLAEFGADEESASTLTAVGLWERRRGGWKFVHWRKHQDGDYRPNIPKRVRLLVLSRDGYRCVWCGSAGPLQLDHIVRYRDDGSDSADNLRTLCAPCNQRRG